MTPPKPEAKRTKPQNKRKEQFWRTDAAIHSRDGHGPNKDGSFGGYFVAACSECQKLRRMCLNCGSDEHISTNCHMAQWAAYLTGEHPLPPKGRSLITIGANLD